MSNDSNADNASEFSRQFISKLGKHNNLGELNIRNNSLFIIQEEKPQKEGWEPVDGSATCWIHPGLNQKRRVPAIQKLLEACGVTSAKLTYSRPNDPKKLGFNRIIFGAPGTGKSWILNQEVESCFNAKFERVTFHPEYTYFDFVGSYKPVMNGENIQYKFVAGPFARMLKLALDAQKTNSQDKFCLIVEEINRARVAAVFGDIFQLLDRNESGESVYEIMPSLELFRYLMHDEKQKLQDEHIKPIRIPSNLFIWATMNSADQGVYTMDTAFKRRWSFKYIGINDGEDDVVGNDEDVVSAWKEIRARINNLLQEAKVNEDKQLGPFFLHGKELEDGVSFLAAFKSKVLMYLYEDAARHKRNEIFKTEGIRYSDLCDSADDNSENLLSLFKEVGDGQEGAR